MARHLIVKGRSRITDEEREMLLAYALVLAFLAVGYGFSSVAWLLTSTACLDGTVATSA
ncbi:MAG TPA: hypothetical protein VEG61_07680 [Candidatus Dormibacteraeota bacterium]|nr:hypothetical protein [Candidatus Dormibacteraeota bacterium]